MNIHHWIGFEWITKRTYVLTIDLVGTVTAVIVTVADEFERDAHLVAARELVHSALLVGAAFMLV